jgi:ABC-type polar amino acid transport system ATPase subunit
MQMIKLTGIDYVYGDGTVALSDISVSLTFDTHEHITAIVGQSGSGKTTLLKCIAGFLKPLAGRIEIDGVATDAMSEKELRKKLGVVFQDLFLFPHLTVLGNLTLALTRVLGMTEEDAVREAKEMLAKVSVIELFESYPAQLSGGQAQRVAIARALVMKPRYVLLDEPTSALDINTTNAFGTLLHDLQETSNFIIVTHDLPFVRSVAKRAVLIDSGRILTHDQVETVMDQLIGDQSEV